MSMTRFETSSSADVEHVKERARILLVTATNVETTALHAHLHPLRPSGRCSRMTVGNQTYYIGRLGRYGVIHVQCQMGSVLPGASECTVAEAIAFWGVKAVVMVGIAFGVDRTKQRIGDVLVSKTVIPYEIKRVGKRKPTHRNPIPPSGAILLNRFSNGRQWQHPLSRRQKARLIPAQLLSGESLIDKKQYRAQLLAAFPQAEGGEMEGAGVFAAAHQKGIEWILVKGICDFADGKKSHKKKSKQLVAATSAASLCAHVFSQPGTLDDLGALIC
jgi:nucleoside phosphorylase